MHQHDLGRRCQNRGLALPRLGGADEAFCELAGMKAKRWVGIWVVHVKLANLCSIPCQLISGCSGRMGIKLPWWF